MQPLRNLYQFKDIYSIWRPASASASPGILRKLSAALPWALPLKLLLSGLLGVFGSAGLLAYASEYATYSYAVQYGFRPPLEGIPYLKAAVALASVLFLLGGAILFSLQFLFVKGAVLSLKHAYASMRWLVFLHKNNPPLYADHIKRVQNLGKFASGKEVFFGSIVLGIIGSTIGWAEAVALNFILQKDTSVVGFTLAMFFATVIMVILMSNEKAAWWTAAVATLMLLIGGTGMMFSPLYYSHFIRAVGYGGGTSVKLELKSSDSAKSHFVEYYLMLRTTDTYVLMDKEGSGITEIPRELVQSLSYAPGGLNNQDFRMPPRSWTLLASDLPWWPKIDSDSDRIQKISPTSGLNVVQ